MKSLILIDGTGLVYRGFYALPPYLTDKNGKPTNAIYGFMSMFLNVLFERKPDYIAVAFDRKEKTFRHEEYVEYKATRTPAPQELYDQIPRVKELLAAMEIPVFELAGYEADDILATLARQAHTWKDAHTYILTGDVDMFQTIDEKTSVLYPNKGFKEADIIGVEEAKARLGVLPSQVTDFKGLSGDSSDNLPGVPGIGPKTTCELLSKYGNLEEIYQHLEELPPGVRKKLEAGRESGIMCKRISTLRFDVPIHTDQTLLQTPQLSSAKVRPIMTELGFQRFLERITKENQQTLL